MIKALYQKRVRILYIGGLSSQPDATLQDVTTRLEEFLDLQMLAKADLVVLANTANQPWRWSTAQAVINEIITHYDNYDGFVVVQGIDDALYTANLVMFAFPVLGKPILFTGPQYNAVQAQAVYGHKDLEDLQNLSVGSNIMSTMQLAVLDYSGVLLAYDEVLRPPVKVFPVIGATQVFRQHGEWIGTPLPHEAHITQRHRRNNKIKLQSYHAQFNPNVTVWRPFFDDSDTPPRLQPNSVAVIIEGGNDPVWGKLKFYPKNTLVIVQSLWLNSERRGNVIVMGHLTWPTLVAKAMHVLADTTNPAKVYQRLIKSEHNEFI